MRENFNHSIYLRYNGDISYVASQVRGRDQLVFGLKYDDYDRMVDAQLYERASTTAPADYGTHYWEMAEYDERGNITELNRRGTYESSNRYYETGFDDLEYTYAGGTNRLQSIDDKLDNGHGYDEGSGNYAYDANGNTTYDPARNINITFNYLNLPESVVWSNGQRIDLTYDATGTLLTRTQKNASGTTLMRRDYVGGLEYLDGDLESVYHEEGRVKLTGSSQEWQYTLTDHLDNTRLVYSDRNGNGVPDVPSEVIQEEHYFPFGIEMVGPWMNIGASMAYRYNGKEYQEDLGLYDYGARWYDPIVGRFTTVDPLASEMPNWSPYSYSFNNPVRFIDPDGRMPSDCCNGNPPFSAAGIIYEAFQNSRAGIYNFWQRGKEFIGLGGLNGNRRMRVNYNTDGTIPTSNPVTIQNEAPKSFVSGVVDAGFDLLALSPAAELAAVRGMSGPFLAARGTNFLAGARGLNTLSLNPKFADQVLPTNAAESIIDFGMDAGKLISGEGGAALNGKFSFVITTGGELKLGAAGQQGVHFNLSEGALNVTGAGQLIVKDGQITGVNNFSGHYTGGNDKAHTDAILEALHQSGLGPEQLIAHGNKALDFN